MYLSSVKQGFSCRSHSVRFSMFEVAANRATYNYDGTNQVYQTALDNRLAFHAVPSEKVDHVSRVPHPLRLECKWLCIILNGVFNKIWVVFTRDKQRVRENWRPWCSPDKLATKGFLWIKETGLLDTYMLHPCTSRRSFKSACICLLQATIAEKQEKTKNFLFTFLHAIYTCFHLSSYVCSVFWVYKSILSNQSFLKNVQRDNQNS